VDARACLPLSCCPPIRTHAKGWRREGASLSPVPNESYLPIGDRQRIEHTQFKIKFENVG
jgi:hypothetical protein